MQEIEKQFDCTIVGGGMVGAALALGLAKRGFSIAVIERHEPSEYKDSQTPDIRLSAFNMHSIKLLKELEAWQHVLQMRYRSYNCLKCWDGETPALSSSQQATSFHADEVNEQELGYFVENRLIQLALYAEIKSSYHDKVDFIFEQSITNIDSELATVQLANNTIIKSEVLFGADGANSLVRQAAGIGTTGWQYAQQANAILIETSQTLPSETWQAFYHSGPRALLPMFKNYACLVWYDNAMQSKWMKQANEEQLHTAIIKSFPDVIGNFTIKQRASFGLTRMHANHYGRGRAIIVGDAAHTINPLAGQGVNLGLQDVAAIFEALSRKGLADVAGVISAYEKSRKTQNLLMMSTMDLLYKGFSTPSLPLQILRGIGLKAANNAGPIKRKALKYAMGI
jgi:2-octaprenyl-3-methyl-6-methoxy-1,4-benzoquinol hydroxylase